MTLEPVPEPCPGTRHGPDPVPGTPVWCRTCAADLQAGLVEIQRLAALVHRHSDGYARSSGGTVPARRGGTGTDGLRVIETLDVLAWELARTYWRYASRHAVDLGRHPRTPLGWLMAWERVASQLPDMVGHPDMASYLSRLMIWRTTLARLAGDMEVPMEPVRGLRCPSCHYLSVLVVQQDGSAVCSACRAGVPPERLVLLHIRP